jgi:hypothetical protein
LFLQPYVFASIINGDSIPTRFISSITPPFYHKYFLFPLSLKNPLFLIE